MPQDYSPPPELTSNADIPGYTRNEIITNNNEVFMYVNPAMNDLEVVPPQNSPAFGSIEDSIDSHRRRMRQHNAEISFENPSMQPVQYNRRTDEVRSRNPREPSVDYHHSRQPSQRTETADLPSITFSRIAIAPLSYRSDYDDVDVDELDDLERAIIQRQYLEQPPIDKPPTGNEPPAKLADQISNGDLKDVICAICRDELHNEDKGIDENIPGIAVTPCSHLFHAGCLKLQMKHSKACPLCRTEMSHAKEWLSL